MVGGKVEEHLVTEQGGFHIMTYFIKHDAAERYD